MSERVVRLLGLGLRGGGGRVVVGVAGVRAKLQRDALRCVVLFRTDFFALLQNNVGDRRRWPRANSCRSRS